MGPEETKSELKKSQTRYREKPKSCQNRTGNRPGLGFSCKHGGWVRCPVQTGVTEESTERLRSESNGHFSLTVNVLPTAPNMTPKCQRGPSTVDCTNLCFLCSGGTGRDQERTQESQTRYREKSRILSEQTGNSPGLGFSCKHGW